MLFRSGIPTVGFTWYSLTDQVDWDVALREQRGTVNPLGLYDLDRNIRAVGRAYKQLIRDWRDVLPASSVCLAVPVKPLHQGVWPPLTTPPGERKETQDKGLALGNQDQQTPEAA